MAVSKDLFVDVSMSLGRAEGFLRQGDANRAVEQAEQAVSFLDNVDRDLDELKKSFARQHKANTTEARRLRKRADEMLKESSAAKRKRERAAMRRRRSAALASRRRLA